MTIQRQGLAGTAYAYRRCAGCPHMWIRHNFGPRPSCSDGGYVYEDDLGNKIPMTYKKCTCPGWREPGTQTAEKDTTMTTPTERATADAVLRPWATAHDVMTRLAAAQIAVIDGEYHTASHMLGNAIVDTERVLQQARRALAHLHLHHGTAQPATTAPAGPAPLQPITTPATPATGGSTQ